MKTKLLVFVSFLVISAGLAVLVWQGDFIKLNNQNFSFQPKEVLAQASSTASIWYVRPKQAGKYGTGDGKSYENAFNGYGNGGEGIIWGVSGVHAGDTLYVCDTHHDTTIPFDVFASGAAGNVITIRGDYPNHPAIMTFGNPGDGTSIHINNSYITYRNIAFNHFNCRPQLDTINSTNITFDGCVFRDGNFAGYSYFDLGAGNDYWVFNNCDMADNQNGIYTHHESNLSANYLTVTNSKFDNMGNAPWTDGDGHAIGIQGGIGHVIEGNYCNNTGSAIQFYASPTESIYMGGCTVRYNFIKNTTSGASGSGIEVYDLTEGATGDNDGYVIDYNIILNTHGAGIHFGTIEPRSFLIRNNTVLTTGNTGEGYPYGIAVFAANGHLNGVIYNNIIMNPYGTYISATLTNAVSLLIDKNLYFSNIGAKLWFGYSDFSAYQIATGFDAHGINVDPQLISSNPLLPVDFKLKSTSPAINTGFNWGQTNDFFGNLIQGTPDIGAIEFQSTSSPTLFPNITLTKSADKTQASQGEEITYTIAYNNTGTGGATDVVITDVIPTPTGATYVTGSATGNPGFANNTLTWTIGPVPSGGSGSMSFKVKVN